ncbi:MAG: hypothetical protein HC929_19025, partial [Leptolyngbyaceae cyanobacterium SM2_5_2]|nr:hypothetical protein [Leptolyngbyaceae cyanobacterium SM2_5_2]
VSIFKIRSQLNGVAGLFVGLLNTDFYDVPLDYTQDYQDLVSEGYRAPSTFCKSWKR